MDYKLLISILALVISAISLSWNIWTKVRSEKKKILIQCTKNNYSDKCSFVITITNVGKKAINIRRIEIEELVDNTSKKTFVNYSEYKDLIENKPINPDEWRTIVLWDKEKKIYVDQESGKLKTHRVLVVEPNNTKHTTKWFRQNNLKT